VVDGKSIDLLEGIEQVTDDSEAVKLHKTEDLFYTNLHKAISSGLTFK
jgi:hypothetical protein